MIDEIFDLDELMERVQEDKELLVELLDIFVDDFAKKRKLLEQALADDDIEQIKGIAHSLKGASGNISAKILRANFIKLEEVIANKGLGEIKNVFQNLDDSFIALSARIQETKEKFN